MNTVISITREDPGKPEVKRLLEARDALLQALYPPESNHYLDVEAMRQPQMRFFSASLAGEVVGCGGIWLHDDYAEIKSVFVSPESRGLGLAKKLMARLEEEARTAGMKLARLETGIHQQEALGLYRTLSYEICDSFGDYPTDDPNSVFMEKKLA
ncbi:MAG TPA: GNAT family N-acetyltransferase [Aestuariivirga sp.]|nr:GNAT family N-acetyltransferase [Aestuariivirga sp.]